MVIKNLFLFFTFFCFFSCDLWNEEVIENNFINFGDSLTFSLLDQNEESETFEELIGPQYYSDKVVLVYFTSNET